MAQLINKESYVWSQIILTVNGFAYGETKAIEYITTQDKQLNYGLGQDPTSIGRGRKGHSGSITMSLGDIEALRAGAPNGDLLDYIGITINVAWLPKSGNAPIVHILRNVEFTEDPVTANEGDMDIQVTLPFIYGSAKKK
jgi:hypothetical protein